MGLTAWLLGAALVLACALVWRLRARKLHGVPRLETGPFFFGGLLKFLTNFDRNNDWLLDRTLHYGGNWGCTAPLLGPFGGGFVCLADEASVEYVLGTNFDNYVKGETVQDVFHEFLGNGIFATDGAAWKAQRKTASHMFSQRLMREGMKVAITQGSKVLKKLDAAAAAQETLDLQDLFFRFTIDTFCFIAFGIDLHSLEKDHPFAKAFDQTQQGTYERYGRPFWRLGRVLGLSDERRIAASAKTMDSFAQEIIRSRRREVSSGSPLGPDLISRFLADAGEAQMSDSELRDVVINFVIAGRDTTACALSWSFYELLKYPDIVVKLRSEVDPVMHTFVRMFNDGDELDGQSEEVVAFKALTELPYLHAVVSEVLRLHPSVPKQSKYAVVDDVLPDGTRVDAGRCVVYSAYAMGRNPKVWGEDALEFRPERWLGSDGQLQPQPSAFKNVVFNAGPRLCLGKPLAYLEIKLMLCMIVSLFNIHAVGSTSEEYPNSLVLCLKHGLRIKATRRAAD